jgi:hypothetical protein
MNGHPQRCDCKDLIICVKYYNTYSFKLLSQKLYIFKMSNKCLLYFKSSVNFVYIEVDNQNLKFLEVKHLGLEKNKWATKEKSIGFQQSKTTDWKMQ